MGNPQLSLPVAPAYVNRQLLSNRFLDARLREDPLWGDVAERADRLRAELRALLQEQAAPLGGANERQTEERWIMPVLRALGWGFEVQPKSRRQGSTQFPDYGLFRSQADADAASALDARQLLKRATGILEAKRWERPLDAGEGDGNRVPSAQIINYLVRTEQPWGILTNGREWRLYYRDADFADTAYFAVDLPALLGNTPLQLGERGEAIPAAEAFRYFVLFFGPEAFVPGQDGRRWLDLAREASVRYARAVEEALKPRAYRAVTALCRGLVAAAGQRPGDVASDAEAARVVLDNALTLLFRLLFLLHAEARELLPVRTNPAYRRKSLFQLRERAAQARDGGEPLFPRGRDYWNDLHDLFEIVDGAPRWSGVGIPVYDGGLFDPDEHPWLEANYVADPQLAEAIDLLSRVEDPETGRLHLVDYGPLDVRHLGSIYEGLLEYVLRVAERELPPILEHGRRVRDDVAAGELYLATDRGERKSTGSYYTPDAIVQYIVERSLGPLVEGRTPDEILRLRVLDPAMGSGHFLVAATAYLARAAVRAAEEGPQPLLGEFARLEPEHLRRLVVERCIFGVDKNPRAVELAKLALWLATVQRDKALNFLDHHLRCGDSLLGARIRQLGGLPGRRGREARLEAEGQYSVFEEAFRVALRPVLALVQQIEWMPSETAEQVGHKEQLHREAEAALRRFREAADVWMARSFGAKVDGDSYARVLDALRGPDAAWSALRAEPWFAEAERLARLHRFFHWEVEFAEAFYHDDGRERENPGFDAVLGNPPYVRMEQFKELKDFLRATYESYETRSDLYVYFIERSLALLRDGGEYGVIVSNKFLRANYGTPIRALIGRTAAVREVVDFGGQRVFPEATVRAAILLLRRGAAVGAPRFAEPRRFDPDTLEADIHASLVELDPDSVSGEEWRLLPAAAAALLERLGRHAVPLGEYVGGRIFWGIKTGLNEAFFLDRETRDRLIAEDPRSAEVIQPLVVGDEVRRYHLERDDHWLLYIPHGFDIEQYPAVRAHLERFRDRLESRATSDHHAWYELQQPQEGYQGAYDGAKILYPIITRDARFTLQPGPLYPNDKCFLIPGEDRFLLALLNSRLLFYFVWQTAAKLEGGAAEHAYVELRAQYMEKLPVRRIEERTPPRARAEAAAWLESLYFRGLRRAGIEPEVPEDIRELGARIGEVEGVERVLLVGSWARGQARETSDVDLVVVQHPDGARAERRAAIRRRLRGYGRPVDLLVYTPEEFAALAREPATFLGHVASEGVPLYGG